MAVSCHLEVLAGWVYILVLCLEYPQAHPAVVLVQTVFIRLGQGLKSHPKDWESPGVHYTPINICLWPFFGCNQHWARGFMSFMSGSTGRHTGIGIGFKASQKTGQRIKVRSDRSGEQGIKLGTPG